MFLLEKIRKMDEQIDRAFVYAQRIRHNSQQVGNNVHRYQQSMAETNVFLKDIENNVHRYQQSLPLFSNIKDFIKY
jgi:methyl-accepting chemotaxis protein